MPGKPPSSPHISRLLSRAHLILSLAVCHTLWAKLHPHTVSAEDSKLELGIPQKKPCGSAFSSEEQEEEQAGAPWRQPLQSISRMH